MTLTDEYVESFQKEKDYTGLWGQILLSVGPPGGVDPEDPRVLAIAEKVRIYSGHRLESGDK